MKITERKNSENPYLGVLGFSSFLRGVGGWTPKVSVGRARDVIAGSASKSCSEAEGWRDREFVERLSIGRKPLFGSSRGFFSKFLTKNGKMFELK